MVLHVAIPVLAPCSCSPGTRCLLHGYGSKWSHTGYLQPGLHEGQQPQNWDIGTCHIVQYQRGAKVPWTPTVMHYSPSEAPIHRPGILHPLPMTWCGGGSPKAWHQLRMRFQGWNLWHWEPVGHSRVRGGGEDVGPGPLFSAASGTQAQLRGAAARPASRASTPSTAGTAAGQCQLRGGACAASGPIHPRSCCSTTQRHCPLSAIAHWHQTRESWSTATPARPRLCWKQPPPCLRGPLVLWVAGIRHGAMVVQRHRQLGQRAWAG